MHLSKSLVSAGLGLTLLLLCGPLQAQQKAPRAEDDNPEVVQHGSPRAALRAFFDASRTGNYKEAATLLDLPPTDTARGPLLAKRLKIVLDQKLWVDLANVSDADTGRTNDGLPYRIDEIGRIEGSDGSHLSVRLARSERGDWRFSRGTVAHVDDWFVALPMAQFLSLLPETLLLPGPRELLRWQWCALPLLFLLCSVLGYALGAVTRVVLKRVTSHTPTAWDDAIVSELGSPLTVAWAIGLAHLALPLLGLYPPANVFIESVLKGGFLAVMFWAIGRCINVSVHFMVQTPWGSQHSVLKSLAPLTARVLKVTVFTIATITLVSHMGYPVTSLLAGLGVGGLAVALAAQKTLENLLGAFALGTDQTFRQGDTVRIDNFIGIVESVGLRASRFRTPERTLISIPNGKLAEMRIESLSARDRMRFACEIGLLYRTNATQMRQVLASLEQTLRAHPKLWPDEVIVRFKALGESALVIEVAAWFEVREWAELQAIRQDLLLQFMDVVEQAGSGFAYPTQTIHLETPAQPASV